MRSRFRSWLQRSVQGVRVDSERVRDIDPEAIRFLDVVAFFLRAWPYIRPVRWHAATWIAISVIGLLWATIFAFVNFGLIYNSIILNLPLSSIAAGLLGLDPAVWVNVDHLTQDQRYELIPRFIVLAVISTALGATIDHLARYYRVWILQRINQNLRIDLMRQLQALSLNFHAESKPGDAIYRLFQDSAMVTQILQALIVDPFLAGLRFFLGVAVVSAFSPFLGLILLLVWGPMLYLAKRMSAPLRRGFKETRARNSSLTSTIQESIEGIRTIKVHALEKERQRRFDVDSAAAFAASHDARVRLLFFSFVVFLCSALPLVFIELRAALFAHAGADTFFRDALLSFGFAVWNLGAQDQVRGLARGSAGSTDGLITLWGRAQDMAIGLSRVYQILDLTPDVVERQGASDNLTLSNSIRFQNVGFSYPGREVLRDVSFEIPVSQITAVLGTTGAGKSTLALLLMRMFECQKGAIELDGRDLRDFTLAALRKNITLATQENILFSMTVAENIRYARPEASEEEVRQAARIACAEDFVEGLAQGYDTFLGERAAKLSSGQRQRLVLARAVVKNAPILILDEPTAALDAETEHRVMTNLRDWGRQHAILLVTHRLSTARQADRIVFLADGEVVDVGSHEELMARPSAYRTFVEAELRGLAEESA